MASIILTAMISGGVTAMINLMVYAFFTRRWQAQERAFEELQKRVASGELMLREISEKRMAKCEHDILHAAGKRKEIYEYMRDNIATITMLREMRGGINESISGLRQELSRYSVIIGENNATTAELKGVLKIITGQLRIRVGDAE